MARSKQVDPKKHSSKAKRRFAVPATKKTPVLSAKKKPHRFRAGTVALREIRKFQKSFDLLLPKAPFRRLIKEMVNDVSTERHLGTAKITRVTEDGYLALQEAAEAYIVQFFQMTNRFAIHGKRVTLTRDDAKLYHDVNN